LQTEQNKQNKTNRSWNEPLMLESRQNWKRSPLRFHFYMQLTLDQAGVKGNCTVRSIEMQKEIWAHQYQEKRRIKRRQSMEG